MRYYMVHMEGEYHVPEKVDGMVAVYHDKELAEIEAAWEGFDVTPVRIVPDISLWQRLKAWWRQ